MSANSNSSPLAEPVAAPEPCRPVAPLALAWGLAEATFFFIVPDVLLSRLVLSDWRLCARACLWAVAGALVGAASCTPGSEGCGGRQGLCGSGAGDLGGHDR